MILKPGHDKKLIQFWRLWPYLQGRIRKNPNLGQKLIKCALSFERIGGFYRNLDEINTWT